MRIAAYLGNTGLERDARLVSLLSSLEDAGCGVCLADSRSGIPGNTDFLLSVGGDGTFLSAAALVGDSGIPVLGVNLGRLGFLSENRPETVAAALLKGEYTIESRTLLGTCLSVPTGNASMDDRPFALNEVTVHRYGGAMLGVDVTVDGSALPTYWADGLLVATSSGSTAYSLSVGGPIVLPESKVLIIAPIASHNLNVRPLVVPDTSNIVIGLQSRDDRVILTMDNRSAEISPDMKIGISMAQFSLKRVRLNSSDFINALTSKLFWGEDIRNSTGK